MSFRMADKKTAVIINIVFTLFLYFMYRKLAQPGSPYLWNLMPAYVFGIVYSYGRERIEKFLFKNKLNRFIVLFLSAGLVVGSLYTIERIPIDDLRNAAFLFPSLFFSMFIVSLTSIFRIKNKILDFIGSNSFWIYILMQLPLIWLQKFGFITSIKYVYFILALAIVAVMALIGNKSFNYFWNIFAKNHGEASESSNVQLGIAVSYLSLLVSAIGAFVVTPRILENLGDTQYGLLSFATSITAWVTVISSALATSYIRFVTKQKEENKDVGIINTTYLRIFAFTGLGIFVIIVIALVVLFTCNIQLPQYSPEENRMILYLLFLSGLNVALTVIFAVFNNFLTYKKQFIFIKLLALTISFLTFACNLIFTFVTKNVLAVAIVTVVMTSISGAITIVFSFRKEKMTFTKAKHREISPLIRSIIAFSGFVVLTAAVDMINSQLDKTILGIMVDAKAVTDYTLAKYLNLYFLFLCTSILNIYIPKIHELVQKNEKKELSALFLKIVRSQMLVLFLFGGGFYAIGKEFMSLWIGPEKEYIYYYSMVPIALDMFIFTSEISNEVQRAMNKHKFRAILYIVFALINIGLTILLIKVLPKGYEIWGAFIGTAFSMVVGNIIIMNIYNKAKIGLPIGAYFISLFKHAAYAGAGVGVALVERFFLPAVIDNTGRLLIQGTSFVIVYFVLLLIFERKTLFPLMKSVKKRLKAIAKGSGD